MYLKQSSSHGRIILSLVRGYRENGKIKQKYIETFGYLDELRKRFDDPIAHFKDVAKKRTIEEQHIPLTINTSSKLLTNVSRKNIGYSILQKLYCDLEIDKFLNLKQRTENIEYNLNDSLKLLTYSRILNPSSIKNIFENKDFFFDKFNLSLKDIYRSLDKLLSYKSEFLIHLNKMIVNKYERDTSITYYDCTNYYFEIEYNDEDEVDEFGNIIKQGLRKKGPSKEHRPEPIVGMGLLLDKNGLPMTYDIFPGNKSEKLTLRPILRETKAKFDLDKVIVVADKGLNTSDNIFFNNTEHDGYIYSKSIKGADQEFKNWVLESFPNESFIKSRIHSFDVMIKKDDKRNIKTTVIQKQVVYYSKKYDDKAKYERSLVIEKAKSLIANPGKYTRATSVGAASYINNINYDKKTGEVIAKNLSLDLDKIKEEEKYDGYYAIVTSENLMSDENIINTYKGLWKIEESFKITKSEFKTRPIYLSTEQHIKAHFLICFISLLIIRLLELKLKNKYSPNKLIETLINYSCSHIEQNYYLFDFRNDIIEDIENIFHVDFSNKYLKLSEIKKILQHLKN